MQKKTLRFVPKGFENLFSFNQPLRHGRLHQDHYDDDHDSAEHLCCRVEQIVEATNHAGLCLTNILNRLERYIDNLCGSSQASGPFGFRYVIPPKFRESGTRMRKIAHANTGYRGLILQSSLS